MIALRENDEFMFRDVITDHILKKDAKITPLTLRQYAAISGDIYDETHRVECAGMTAGKCI